MTTLFDECKEALSNDFRLLSLKEEQEVLEKFYQYPFIYGNIDNKSVEIKSLSFDGLMGCIRDRSISSDVYILADINGIPIFKTNLQLVMENLDDVSALSTKVFLLGDDFLAQIVSKNPPLNIVKLCD